MSNPRYDFGGVTGPVQTSDGVQYYAGRDQTVVHGDQYSAGRDQTVSIGAVDPVAEVANLRQALEELRLTAAERDRAERDLAALQQAVEQPEPDRPEAGRRLHTLTEGLKEAGALATAGSSLVESLVKLATWLGPLGAAVLALL